MLVRLVKLAIETHWIPTWTFWCPEKQQNFHGNWIMALRNSAMFNQAIAIKTVIGSKSEHIRT